MLQFTGRFYQNYVTATDGEMLLKTFRRRAALIGHDPDGQILVIMSSIWSVFLAVPTVGAGMTGELIWYNVAGTMCQWHCSAALCNDP